MANVAEATPWSSATPARSLLAEIVNMQSPCSRRYSEILPNGRVKRQSDSPFRQQHYCFRNANGTSAAVVRATMIREAFKCAPQLIRRDREWIVAHSDTAPRRPSRKCRRIDPGKSRCGKLVPTPLLS